MLLCAALTHSLYVPQADQRSTERLFGQQHLSALWELPQHHLVRPSSCLMPAPPVLVSTPGTLRCSLQWRAGLAAFQARVLGSAANMHRSATGDPSGAGQAQVALAVATTALALYLASVLGWTRDSVYLVDFSCFNPPER